MDLIQIFNETFIGLNFGQIIAGLIAGVLIAKLFDNVLFFVLGKIWPEKYLGLMYKWVEEFDQKYLDKFEEKYPKAGKKLRQNLIDFLNEVEKRIQ